MSNDKLAATFHDPGEPTNQSETLSHLLRRMGPFKPGQMMPARIMHPKADDFNKLRRELLEPRLGLATTEELLGELEARFRLDGYGYATRLMEELLKALPKKILNYRTVDGE